MSKAAKASRTPDLALAKTIIPPSDAGITKKSKGRKAQQKQSVTKDGESSVAAGKATTKKHNKHRELEGICELRVNIYNQDQVRAPVYHQKLTTKQDFYINHPIPPAPTRSTIVSYMKAYANRVAPTKDSSEKESPKPESSESPILPLAEALKLAADDDAHINISQPASVRLVHAIDVALGSVFDVISGVYDTPKKLTVSMLLGAIKTQVHFHHTHPKHRGDLELLLKACTVLADVKKNKDLIIKAKGKPFYKEFQAGINDIFKQSLQNDMSPLLYRGEGLEGAYLRYKVKDAEKSCHFILELYARLIVAEVVQHSSELAIRNSMVTITDQICARALSIMGFDTL